jgi:4-hydroxythreonine-4-phosphate dehydrogenase
VKAALHPRVRALCAPVVIGARDVLAAHAGRAALKRISVIEIESRAFHVGKIHPDHGRAALDAARRAIEGALAGEYAAVVAAPHSEQAIGAAGIEFDGYPSFVARTAGLAPEQGILMLCFRHAGREVRIAHVTLHAAVRRAVAMISTERVLATVKATGQFLGKVGIERPKIAVSGVNPHAVGDEEETLIKPAIRVARADGLTVEGPIGADSLVQRAGYDAYVVMLHDQGHVAAKVLAPNRAAALTIGTPVLFSSVAHGAAFDLAGRNRADPGAMVEAITRLVGRRRRASRTKKNS